MVKINVFIALLKNDLKLFFKDWKAVILLVTVPFIFIAFFMYALTPYLDKTSFIDPFAVALVDNEDSVQTRMLVRQFDDISIFSEVLRVDSGQAAQLISQNRVAATILIPAGFTQSIVEGENEPVTVIGNRSMPLQAYVVKNLMDSAANLVSAGQSAINTIYHFDRQAGVDGQELNEEFNKNAMAFFLEVLSRSDIFSEIEASPVMDLTPAEYFTAALTVIFLMFAGMPAMKMLVTERRMGLTRRIAASPVKMWQIILSKFMVSLLLSLIQFSIIIVLTSKVFGNYWGAPVRNIILVFAGTVFAVAAWSVFVSSISKTPAAADVIGNLGILLSAVVGGSIYPLSSMPGFVRSISKITINRWAMDGFMVLFSGNDALNVNNVVLALFTIGVVLISSAALVLKVRRD